MKCSWVSAEDHRADCANKGSKNSVQTPEGKFLWKKIDIMLVKASIKGGSLVKIGRWRYYQEDGTI
jgi:hypothetical protein